MKAIFLFALIVAVSAKINPSPMEISFDLPFESNEQASSMVLTPNGTVFALDGPGDEGSMLALLAPGSSNLTYNVSVGNCYSTLSYWEEQGKVVYLCQQQPFDSVMIIFEVGNSTFEIYTNYTVPDSGNNTLYTPYDEYITRNGSYYLVLGNGNGSQSLIYANLADNEYGFTLVVENLTQAANASDSFDFSFFTITNDDEVVIFLGDNGTLIMYNINTTQFNTTYLMDGVNVAAFGLFRGADASRDGFIVYVSDDETEINSTMGLVAAYFNDTVERVGDFVEIQVGTFEDFELAVGIEEVFVALNYLDSEIPAGVFEFAFTLLEGFAPSDNVSVPLMDLINPLMAVDSLSSTLVVAGFNVSNKVEMPEFLYFEYSFDQ